LKYTYICNYELSYLSFSFFLLLNIHWNGWILDPWARAAGQ
jgi:hypothetical protein